MKNTKLALGVINATDKKVYLCERDGYYVTMQRIGDSSTKVCENYKVYLTSKETGIPFLSSGQNVKISAVALRNANDATVMKGLKKFMINLTEDDLKMAFDRARKYDRMNTAFTDVSTSKTIGEAYYDLIEYVKKKVLTGVNEKGGEYVYDEQKKNVEIRTECMEQALEACGSGYNSKVVFCKDLKELESHYNVKLLDGSKGRYGTNNTNNIRVYRLYISDAVMDAVKAERERNE